MARSWVVSVCACAGHGVGPCGVEARREIWAWVLVRRVDS
jgi:hypothetical protein